MNLTKRFLVASATLFAAVSAAMADVTIDITGATAFRAAANNAIIQALGGSATVEYAFTGTQGIDGTNRAIFRGTFAGIPGTTTIRTSWSGSAAGVAAVANTTPVELLVESTPVAVGGLNLTAGQTVFETAVAKFAFSDVAQAATPTPAPALEGTEVGVVPFVFLVNDGAPAGITNVTDQLMQAVYKSGFAPVSMFTGNSADTGVVLGTGRNNGSGTRITILAETGFGFDNTLVQYQASVDTANDQIAAGSLTLFERNIGTAQNPNFIQDPNFGYSSNSFVRDILSAKTDANFPGVTILSYLTLSDATAAQTNDARWLTYNGVPYTEENLKNGSYSLWGYQWFYNTTGLSADETTFKNGFVAGIPAGLLPSAGFPIPDMNVDRVGGDGGQILPQ